MNDDGLPLDQVARHLVDGHRPFRAKFEVAPMASHGKLALDRGTLLLERELIGVTRVGGKKEDDLSGLPRSLLARRLRRGLVRGRLGARLRGHRRGRIESRAKLLEADLVSEHLAH
jgi:hypothetical protein